MQKYIINSNTIAIVGIDSNNCKIIEREKVFIVKESSMQVIEDSCLYYGCSYQGRVEASAVIVQNAYKVPIVVESDSNLVYFPTTSPNSELCIWISIAEVLEIIVDEEKEIAQIILQNDQKIVTNLSAYTIENQMFKSYRLASVMKKRKLM